ncbi:DUF3039 domain-containing protein [Arthrobacter sp. TMN-37]
MFSTTSVPDASSISVLDSGDFPVVNHRIRKDLITRSIVEGVRVPALCGEHVQVYSRGSGRLTQATRGVLVLCPMCEHMLTMRPAGGAA